MSKVEEATEVTPDTARRNFLRNMVGMAGVAAVATPLARKAVSPASVPLTTMQTNTLQVTAVDGPQDPIERMRSDMARAMQKPVDQRR